MKYQLSLSSHLLSLVKSSITKMTPAICKA
uniref:Uncharacterized protein n=1 Tax=Rhizophora mucronata TaxID=61149 RepID=A0A2P2PK36_RHIMU